MSRKNNLASLSLMLIMMLSLIAAPVSAASGLQASFTADPTSGNAPLVVLFKSTSTGNPSVYNWNFGDGSTSRSASTWHTYLKPGQYTVTLTVTRGTLSSTATQVISVPGTTQSTTHPRAHFTVNLRSGKVPLTVQFTDTSAGSPTAWLWSFGDGTYSRDKNPTHTYTKAGTYTVTLRVWNSVGACSNTYVNYITVTA